MTRNFLIILLGAVMLSSCSNPGRVKQQAGNEENALLSTGSFGKEISPEGAIPAPDLVLLFTDQDTVKTKISGNVTSSCQHTGCWMDLDIGEGKTVHVTFADDAFTIPLDAAGKNAIVEGLAIREMVPVETLRNYAREEGMPEDQVAGITEPEWDYEFIASGVILRNE